MLYLLLQVDFFSKMVYIIKNNISKMMWKIYFSAGGCKNAYRKHYE